jgi:mono/diheme cytochrome c family protein
MPAEPTGADLGSITWWGVCLACHGDKGQGLTDEWRELAFGEDMNCWKSKCHAANHPPEGFYLIRQVPPAIGPGSLKRFVTAADLQHYLKKKMPWWKPGSLSEEEAWQLTAYLMRSSSLLPVGEELAIDQASFLAVHLPVRPVQDERGWQIILTALLAWPRWEFQPAKTDLIWRANASISSHTEEPLRPTALKAVLLSPLAPTRHPHAFRPSIQSISYDSFGMLVRAVMGRPGS